MPPLPNGYRFVQQAGFGFVLVGGSSSVAARVTWQWTQPAPAAATLWKFGPTAGNATPHWYDAKAQFNGARTSGSFSLTDGADGDADRLVNGVIVDPVFLVEPTAITEPSNPASVPTLSEIARTLLALALAGFAALSLRRRVP
ncbi:IPTL-CTERM sorting domain-containing protein [Diaphorobacter aerolatus]|uniref:IPTL-CTERM sorting domain-containing protein n=1 Tax=Diaphorobacter aerolatus TaxID=1288495 RepID=UPI001D02A3C3